MPEDHFDLVNEGLAFHEARQYRVAPYFERELAIQPGCATATYNKANTLHMLGRNDKARSILLRFVDRSDDDMLKSCPFSLDSPRSLRLDAYNLLFLTTLYSTESWPEASKYLRKHLRLRTRGLKSSWSKREIICYAEELRHEFSPRSSAVTEWVETQR